ncbi:hypothetical protein ACSBR2_039451 [Camellia fascicularis]
MFSLINELDTLNGQTKPIVCPNTLIVIGSCENLEALPNSYDDGDCDSVSDTKISIDTVVDAVIDLQKGRRELAKFMCLEGRLQIVSLVAELFPWFPLDYDSLKDNCLQIYEEDKLRVKHILTNMDGQISLSVESLSYVKRNGSTYEFMCLAAHFIDDKWKLKKWVLSFQPLWVENNDCLDQAILKSLKDWHIKGKIAGRTLANINVYDEVVQITKDSIQEKKRLQLNGQLFCVNCCAEMFTLMTEDAFKEISNIIRKVRCLILSNYSPRWDYTAFKLKQALDLELMVEFSSQHVVIIMIYHLLMNGGKSNVFISWLKLHMM